MLLRVTARAKGKMLKAGETLEWANSLRCTEDVLFIPYCKSCYDNKENTAPRTPFDKLLHKGLKHYFSMLLMFEIVMYSITVSFTIFTTASHRWAALKR